MYLRSRLMANSRLCTANIYIYVYIYIYKANLIWRLAKPEFFCRRCKANSCKILLEYSPYFSLDILVINICDKFLLSL
jgi:hypothetical protein